MKEPNLEGTPFSQLPKFLLSYIVNSAPRPIPEGSDRGIPLDVLDYVGRRYASILLRERSQ